MWYVCWLPQLCYFVTYDMNSVYVFNTFRFMEHMKLSSVGDQHIPRKDWNTIVNHDWDQGSFYDGDEVTKCANLGKIYCILHRTKIINLLITGIWLEFIKDSLHWMIRYTYISREWFKKKKIVKLIHVKIMKQITVTILGGVPGSNKDTLCNTLTQMAKQDSR